MRRNESGLRNSGLGRRRGRCLDGAAFGRDVDLRSALGRRAFVGLEAGARAATARLLGAARVTLFYAASALAFDRGLGQLVDDQLDRAHGVVVAGDRQVDQVWVAVGVD